MNEKKQIEQNDLKSLQLLRNDCDQQMLRAKLEMQNASLVWQNAILQLKLKYNISEQQELILETGEIKDKE